MMNLLCPYCGQETPAGEETEFACARCGGWLRREPNGKAWVLRPAAQKLPGEEEALALVAQSDRISNPQKRKKLLDQALALCPDSLGVNKAVLLFGRLGEPCKDILNYRRIKCYLLHAFSGEEKSTDQKEMLAELTEDPQLQRCLSLAPDRDAFIREYFLDLCRQYLNLFIKGSNRYNGSFLGFRLGSLEKNCAAPVAEMLRNMQSTPLPPPYGEALPAALKRAYETEIGSFAWVEKEGT